MSNHSARINMVKQQLRTGGVLNEAILNLYDTIPRHEFVPSTYEAFAYSDMQIPLPFEQRMLTPLEEGSILQALNLKGTETVLEVGTGSGFFTALLSKLAKQVLSVDYFQEFTINAGKKLEAHGCHNVTLVTADGSRGLLEKAPYDVMVFTGGLEKLTKTHSVQLLPGGKLIAIEGKAPVMQVRLYNMGAKEIDSGRLLFETLIPELINQIKPSEFVF